MTDRKKGPRGWKARCLAAEKRIHALLLRLAELGVDTTNEELP